MATASRTSGRHTHEREVKTLSADLTALLAKKDPWHPDVVFVRENLRRHCLALVFQSPPQSSSGSSKGGNDVNPATAVQSQARKRLQGLNVLFLITSHNIIHHYRSRLSAVDKALADQEKDRSSNIAPAAQGGGAGRGGKRNGDRGGKTSAGPTPAQRKRLLHSFREFLTKEETFWRDLLIRLVGVFDVEEARIPLRQLQLGVGDWEPDPLFTSIKEIHSHAILLCHKTLICFGDLARYRELYTETKPVPAAQPKPRGGKLNPAAIEAASSKEKSFARAFEAYHQARLLVPDDGNPSNQLAVLAGYQKDELSTIYHYYRALCVRKPFTTATQNLSATYKKMLSHWDQHDRSKEQARAAAASKADVARMRSRNGAYTNNDLSQKDLSELNRRQDEKHTDNREVTERFRKNFTVLHAMLFEGSHLDELPHQFTTVTKLFSTCVAKRSLPSDVVVKAVVTALSTWWYARMYRPMMANGKSKDHKKDSKAVPVAAKEEAEGDDSASLESSAFMHALALITELLEIAILETRDVVLHEALQHPPTAPESSRPMLLAQSITAVLRRALPALRIASMWLLSNVDYLSKYDTTSAHFHQDDPTVPPELCNAMKSFWNSYANFANSIGNAFPLELLPITAGDLMLEEDVDMLGYAPLRRRMKEAKAQSNTTQTALGSDLHPNEEQVLRIGDLLGDANLLAQSESCPIALDRGFFVIRKKRLNPASTPWQPRTFAPANSSPAFEPLEVSPSSEDGEESLNSFEDIPYGRDLLADHEAGASAPAGRSGTPAPTTQVALAATEGEDDEAEAEVDTERSTEDDVLDLVMRVATGNEDAGDGSEEEDDGEEDQVLYPSRIASAFAPGASAFPTQLDTPQTASPRIPASAARPPSQSPGAAARSQIASQVPPQSSNTSLAPPPPLPGRTASDLLLQVLQGNSLDLHSTPRMSAASPLAAAPPQTGLPPSSIASSNVGALGGHSIWSAGPPMPVSQTAGIGLARTPVNATSRENSANSTPKTGSGLALGGAEARFNSMPNQSQQSSPFAQPQQSPFLSSNLGSFGAPGHARVPSQPSQPGIFAPQNAAPQSYLPPGFSQGLSSLLPKEPVQQAKPSSSPFSSLPGMQGFGPASGSVGADFWMSQHQQQQQQPQHYMSQAPPGLVQQGQEQQQYERQYGRQYG